MSFQRGRFGAIAATLAVGIVAMSGGCLRGQGYYTPVTPQPQQQRPCGHYGMAPCASSMTPSAVNIPPGATAEQILDMGLRAFAQGNYPLSAGYMEKAAAMGNVRAEASLGLDYVHGKGEPQDDEKAIYWLTKAAEQGHRVAQAELGDLYEDGPPVEQNLTKAFHYHLASAQQRWWQGELRVGLEYELGYGTPHNRQAALMWLDRATKDGQDGFSQDVAIMLRRSDTPARFRDMNDLVDHVSALLNKSFTDATTPHFPPGKHCHEHSSTATSYSGHYSSFYCD